MNLRAIFDDLAYGTYRRHSGAGTTPYGVAVLPTFLAVFSMTEPSDSSNEARRTKNEERFCFTDLNKGYLGFIGAWNAPYGEGRSSFLVLGSPPVSG